MTRLLSLITCTRNPDDAGLDEVLAAVRALRVPDGWLFEHLLVDNASTVPMAERPSVARHLQELPSARVVRDDTDGLSVVRSRAIRAAQGELLVTVDDDNVLDRGYLGALVAAADDLPHVAVFGAGRIQVRLLEDAPAWASDPWVLQLFQERTFATIEHGTSRSWQAYYAPGTGMAVRRSVALAFADGVERGVLRNASRRRGRLGGGEDAQLNWLAVQGGQHVGVVPGMSVVHRIHGGRLSPTYLRRLVFGIHESAAPARAEVFRDEPLPAWRPFRVFVRGARRVPIHPPAVVVLARVAAAAADAAAICQMHERPEPWWLRTLIALLSARG
ncbi:MAG: glycosyltransferase family 2 protein [Gemmatimonadetes bacterium]|nr:glycosyltransferase family 2 protein [Gemmatimonadota bacterium]